MSKGDMPHFFVHDGFLTITAKRQNETIMIKMPFDPKCFTFSKVVELPQRPAIDIKKATDAPKRRNRSSASIRRGDSHPFSLLTERKVREIKERLSSKVFMAQFRCVSAAYDAIGKEYNVSGACISHINAQRTWRHVV